MSYKRSHEWEDIPGPIDQESCRHCVMNRMWDRDKDRGRTIARYFTGSTHFLDMIYGVTDEPPCARIPQIEAWIVEQQQAAQIETFAGDRHDQQPYQSYPPPPDFNQH